LTQKTRPGGTDTQEMAVLSSFGVCLKINPTHKARKMDNTLNTLLQMIKK